jgi:deoxyribodipyrimidine photo-lyase
MINNNLGIFIFRKDLRLYDNLGLIELSKKCKYILPIFIFDDYQVNITETNQYYRSNNAIQFMCESLIDLNKQLNNKLILFKGSPIIILENIFKLLLTKYNNIILAFNLDYTQYALKRDLLIKNLCTEYNIPLLNIEHDHTLIPFNKMIKNNGLAYMVYGSFYKNAIKTKVNEPIKCNFTNFIRIKELNNLEYKIQNLSKLYKENQYIAQHGGRAIALKKIINHDIYIHYKDKRDLLTFNTYQVSAALNFGCISIREFYNIIKSNIEIRKQLYWRDFYTCILRYIPNANSYNKMINNRFNLVKWPNNEKNWKLMMESKTGYLIIDAAMKELIQTGYIGNRVRLILATFWIKYLLINPLHSKYGSQVGFSRYLVDCNTSQNKLNHQWFTDLDLPGRRFAKRGCNSLTGRMMRIDNEVIKKFDPECKYIKKWLPELANVPNKDLYKWNLEIQKKYKLHVSPIFDWQNQYKKYCNLFKNI